MLPPRVSLPIRARVGFSREPEMHLLPRFVGRGDTVLDIGAHLGIYAYRLAHLVQAEGKVICFEPQPQLAQYLRTGLAGRKYRHVDILNEGLSDHEGTAWMSIPIEGTTPNLGRATLHRQLSHAGMEVPVRRLDDFDSGRRISFVKCDVEGHELPVLRGGEKTLVRDRPALLVEIEYDHAGEDVVQTFQFLADLGYGAYYFDSRRVLRAMPAPETLGAERINHPADDAYVVNFLFLPRHQPA